MDRLPWQWEKQGFSISHVTLDRSHPWASFYSVDKQTISNSQSCGRGVMRWKCFFQCSHRELTQLDSHSLSQ